MTHLINANAVRIPLRDESVHMIACSSPYWGLRDYGADGQLGQEPLHDCEAWARGERPCGKCFVCNLRIVAAEAWRVLRDDGTFWLNLGDSFVSKPQADGTLKEKDLSLIPPRVALALQADGWYVRSDVIWSKCLSGGTLVYARTQKGEMPMTVNNLVRLDPATVQLWTGEKWSNVIGWWEHEPDADRERKSQDRRVKKYLTGTEQPVMGDIELHLRSGERIGCTRDHKWPTQRGLVESADLVVGDVLQRCLVPEPLSPQSPERLPDDIGWFVGMYLAEGSRGHDGTCIQIASHGDEMGRFEKLSKIADLYGGTCRMHHTLGNSATINMYGHVLNAIIDTYISGNGAKNKHLSVTVWKRGNDFLANVLAGYLEGDGHYDKPNNRWRLGFTRNDNLAQDLRTLSGRLGFSLRLKRAQHKMGDKPFPGYRGQIRFDVSDHHNNKSDTEIVKIEQSRARKFWDIAIEDEPHLFALASGVLTHNSNPMSESVNGWRWERHHVKVEKSFEQCPGCEVCQPNGGYILRKGAWRPTRAHEFVFLLAKSPEYYCDKYAVTVPYASSTIDRLTQPTFDQQTGGPKDCANGTNENRSMRRASRNLRNSINEQANASEAGRNMWTVWGIEEAEYMQFVKWKEWVRFSQETNDTDVWEISTKGYPGAHFAVWPNELVNPMIKAATSDYGVCPECGAPWARVIEKGAATAAPGNPNPVKAYPAASKTQGSLDTGTTLHMVRTVGTVDWMPTCNCGRSDAVPAFVLDLFAGSGTTLQEARALGRTGIGIDISFEYLSKEARSRLELDELESWNRGDGALMKSNPRARKQETDPRQGSIFDFVK